MIRNLNQISFQGFGNVQSERAHMAKNPEKDTAVRYELTQGELPVYRAGADTYLRCAAGMCVLSVSLDGEAFQNFYLDKPVQVRSGVFFCLNAFQQDGAVWVAAAILPQCVGQRGQSSLRLDRKLQSKGIFTFFYQEKEQGFLFPGEAHSMPELTYVDQGELHSVVDGNDMLLKQGDLVIYGPNQWHMQYADIGVAPRFVTISFEVAGDGLEALLNRKFAAPQSVVRILQNMLREQERMDDYANDVILAELDLVLLTLLREAAAPKAGKLQTSNAVHSEHEIIRQAQQYISAHIREKLSVPLVARKVDVSPSYLTALFHKNLQISPGEYIRRLKLQESKQMIRENNLNFTQIAEALQYSTVHHFSRQFKEKFGITPTEYAKSVR